MRAALWIMAGLLGTSATGMAQRQGLPPSATQTAPRRTRLILKDGSYQVVMSYQVVGDRVRIVSAERGGQVEDIPLELVDLEATKRWEKQHAPAEEGAEQGPPVLDPELQKEEAERAQITPEVAPDLRLPVEDSVLVLDTFEGTPELVPLNQQKSELNKQTGHSIIRAVISPRASTHQIEVLKGEKADVQLHVSNPVIYVRLDDAQPVSGEALTVDTHGSDAAAGREKEKKTGPPNYVIVRVDVRQDARVVASFQTGLLGTTERQEDVIETRTTVLPGGHWAKIEPKEPLLFGEYCLVEVVGPGTVNLGVWDFGVHPTAPENRDVLRPETRRRSELGRRRPD